MSMPKYMHEIYKLGPCDDGSRWLQRNESPVQAWLNCSRLDWLAWLVGRLKYEDVDLTYAIADVCIRQVYFVSKSPRVVEEFEVIKPIADQALILYKANIDQPHLLSTTTAILYDKYQQARQYMSKLPGWGYGWSHFIWVLSVGAETQREHGRAPATLSHMLSICDSMPTHPVQLVKAMLPYQALLRRLDNESASNEEQNDN